MFDSDQSAPDGLIAGYNARWPFYNPPTGCKSSGLNPHEILIELAPLVTRTTLIALLLATISTVASADPFDAPTSYYNTATGTGATLKAQLNDIIDGHTVYSYDAARSTLQVTDADPNNPGHMLLVYNRASLNVAAINPGGSIPGWDAGGSWNREHTWPVSRGVGSSGPDYSDLFNLRPSNPSINGSRGNLNFGGAYGQSYGSKSDGGTVWYPGDADAGMIARQAMYMAVRYDGADSGTADLELVAGNPGTANTMGNLNRLMEWHYQAVPDDFERERNQIIYDDYQHNRNPFTDRPEFAWSIFKDQQNDSQLFVGASPAANGGSSTNVDLGSVIVGAASPAAQNVTLHRGGNDGTYYEVTTSGDATSSVEGRYNAFAINTTGSDSKTLAIGLDASTATAGAKSGTVTVNNLDVTNQGGAGVGANDANDTINVSLAVLDHANPSFDGLVDQNVLSFDFGDVLLGSTAPLFAFDVYNLESLSLFTAGLDLDSLLGFGDTSILTTNLLAFNDLDAGGSSGFTAALDTGMLGSFSATYTLAFSDENLPGAANLGVMTLNLYGDIVAVPEPSSICLLVLGFAGVVGWRGRRRAA